MAAVRAATGGMSADCVAADREVVACAGAGAACEASALSVIPGSRIKRARTWAWRWLTSMRGMPRARAKAFAKEVPTSSDPSNPGPLVKATAEISLRETPARFRATSTTGMMFCWWAREASSGTTPPYASCTFWLATTFDRIVSFRITAADVSSHDDSIARITTSRTISPVNSFLSEILSINISFTM